MKSASSQLKTHLSADCTTLATLFKLTRADSTVIALTNHDQPIVYSGVTYLPMDGMTPSANESKSDMSPDNLEVMAFLDSSAIDERDLRGKLYDGADIEMRVVNWADLTQGEMKFRKGYLGSVKLENGQYTAEVRGLNQKLSSVIGDLYGPVCRAELGDSLCTVNMTLFEQNGSVLSAADALTITPNTGLVMKGSSTPTDPAPTGWFQDGIITFTSGTLNGLTYQIKGWDGTTLTLTLPMLVAPSPGDTFSIQPGCNHSADPVTGHCQNKFSNILNHRAEPNIPGLDQMQNYAVPGNVN